MCLAASTTSGACCRTSVTSSMPSTNTKLRTRENCDRIAYMSCRVKAANVATEPEMSASTNSSGLDGCGLRNAGRTGTPPVLSERRTVRLKSSAPRRLWRRLAASRLGQPDQQPVRVDGPQRAEHVVGAGHRPARLEPGVPVHEDGRQGAQHGLVALAQGG